jgi:hypothetical protein
MNNSLSPLAGQPAPKSMFLDLGRLERENYERQPDFADVNQQIVDTALATSPGEMAAKGDQ